MSPKEIEKRSVYPRLTPDEKIIEEGERLKRILDEDSTSVFWLEQIPRQHIAEGKCEAKFCSISWAVGDVYRITVESVLWSPFGPSYRFFHVECFEKIVPDLPSLAPERFKLYDRPRGIFGDIDTWGVMLRKWFEHSGCINLGRIAEYIDAYRDYEEKRWEFKAYHFERFSPEEARDELAFMCNCHVRCDIPIEPILRNYQAKEGDICSVSQVLQHKYVEEMKSLVARSNVAVIPIVTVVRHPEREDVAGDVARQSETS